MPSRMIGIPVNSGNPFDAADTGALSQRADDCDLLVDIEYVRQYPTSLQLL